MSKLNREQIWNAVNQNNDVILQSLKRINEDHGVEFKSARERLINGAIQINTLFLTGWIALLSVGKLNHDCYYIFNFLLFTGCGLHVLVFGLILGSQWETMRLHFRSQERTNEFERVVQKTFVDKRVLIASMSEDEDISVFWTKLSEKDQPIIDFKRDYLKSYDKENGFAWFLGRSAMFLFLFSMVFSLFSFIVLIK